MPSTTSPPRPHRTDPDAHGLRERKKLETRRALIDSAIELSTRQGFDGTTVDDIAGAVGVSARTFHRYFARKEDAVLADSADRLRRFRDLLVEHADAATVLGSVREAALALARAYGEHEARERARSRLVASTPSLRAYNLSLYDGWASTLAEHAATAVGEQPGDRWPATFGGCVMAALTTAIRRWVADDELDLGAEYAAVLELLDGLDRPTTTPHGPAEDRR